MKITVRQHNDNHNWCVLESGPESCIVDRESNLEEQIAKLRTTKESKMRVKISDEVNNTIKDNTQDFDVIWAALGVTIKEQLNTWDPDVTWLNLYVSHDGKPGFVRTLVATEKDEPGETKYCPNCWLNQTIALSTQPNWKLNRADWKAGGLIQEVWPNALPIEREQLISGLCSDQCWDEFMGKAK